MPPVKFKGSTHFRQRIVCSVLTGKTVVIDEIRSEDTSPGIRDFEASFLRLVDKITNGSKIVISTTGTKVSFTPGVIVGGKITHECSLSRSIGWFLEGIIGLAPFGKEALEIEFSGVTNDDQDISVDLIRTVTFPLLKNFGIGEDDKLEIKVLKRGAPPLGGGSVRFKCPMVRGQIKSIQLLDEGKIRRIRGIAYSTKMSPQTGGRMVETARSILNKYTQDIFIYTDHYKGKETGLSPGFGLSLVAETTTGTSLSAEITATPGVLPEDLGIDTAKLLLTEIANGGCVDTINQSTCLLFMVLCPDTISKVRMGKLSPYTVKYLRNLRDFFGVTFRVEADEESPTIILTCKGIGFKNLAKRIY